ncbi:hypothetical protein Rhopal_002597-T1 [Rhodotorula paludigena]|uniref:F-box domain-containing protein n=1 Tax=Rhodotorula paludigena TaxID=86838 RepID=A0AAV5GJE1_9BASI|nr:hypothetical protein Rhopal_002597-T1 [Rhodotorula paludigena]
MAANPLQSGLFGSLPNELVDLVVDHLVGEAAPSSTALLPASTNDEIAALSALGRTCRRLCILVRPRLWARFEPRRPPGASIAAAPALLGLVRFARLDDQLDLFAPPDPNNWDDEWGLPVVQESRPVDVGAAFASVAGAGTARRMELTLSRETETPIANWGSLNVVVLRSTSSAPSNPVALPPAHAPSLTHLAFVNVSIRCSDLAACFGLPALAHLVMLDTYDSCGSHSHGSVVPRAPLPSLWLNNKTSASFLGVVAPLPVGLSVGGGRYQDSFAAASAVSTLRLTWECTHRASSLFFDEVLELLRRSATIRAVLVHPIVPQSFQVSAAALGKTLLVGDEFDMDDRDVERLFALGV